MESSYNFLKWSFDKLTSSLSKRNSAKSTRISVSAERRVERGKYKRDTVEIYIWKKKTKKTSEQEPSSLCRFYKPCSDNKTKTKPTSRNSPHLRNYFKLRISVAFHLRPAHQNGLLLTRWGLACLPAPWWYRCSHFWQLLLHPQRFRCLRCNNTK